MNVPETVGVGVSVSVPASILIAVEVFFTVA